MLLEPIGTGRIHCPKKNISPKSPFFSCSKVYGILTDILLGAHVQPNAMLRRTA
jgi:hypothetical protein